MSASETINDPRLEAKARELYLRTEAGKRAVSDPLPGPLSTAFGPLNLPVDQFEVRPLVAYDWAILKLSNSPVYRQMLEIMQEGEKAKVIEPTDQEQWEIIYLLTRPCKEVDKVFQKNLLGQEAREQIGMVIHSGQQVKLFTACMLQIQRQMETMVRYAQEKTEEKSEGIPGVPDFLASAGNPPPATA